MKILLHVVHDALVAKIWRRLSIHFDPVVILGGGQISDLVYLLQVTQSNYIYQFPLHIAFICLGSVQDLGNAPVRLHNL